MECTLFALIACFNWSNLYLDTAVTYQDISVPYHYWKQMPTPPPRDTGAVESGYTVSTVGYENQNPYGRVGIGFKLPFRSIDLSAEVFHESSISTKTDRGVNGIAIRAQWFPFR